MKYNYLDDRRLHRKLITSLWIITLLIVVLVTVGIIIFVDSIKDDKHTSDVTTNPTESVIATRDNIIRSSYFQFQAPEKLDRGCWRVSFAKLCIPENRRNTY